MPEYNKLVRDNIPEIITADGMTAETRTLSDSEYELALIEKVGEEAREVALADTTEALIDELADLQEVIIALARHISSEEHLEEARLKKAKERGAFEKRIFLERTDKYRTQGATMSDLRQETIDTYDKSAEALAAYFQGSGSRVNDIEKALTYAGTLTNARSVEIGCGDGRDAKEITPHCSFFTAFDISKELIKIAKKNVPEVQFEVADAVTFEYPEELDVVFAFASLLHLDRDELKIVFQKVTSSLKKDGVFYISLKHRDQYESAVKQDDYGKRLFYFYNRETIEEIAGSQFTTIESYVKHHGNTDWLEIALRKQ